VPGLAAGVVQRLHRQAKLQVESKGADRPKFEVLDHGVYEAKDKGLYMLPEASPHDVYFDIEGYPFVKGGLEYLWGAVHRSSKECRYKEHWAHDDVQERAAFEAFIDWVYGIWRKDPAMRVYHYGSYEASVIKRFAGRFGSREDEVDELLYGGVFVDLHQIVKESIAVGVDTYSLKEIERLYRDGRVTAVADATSSIVVYDNWVAAPDGGTSLDSPLLGSIRDYNREDCESMVGLVEFLRGIRKKAKIESPAPCPAEPASEVERKGEDKRRLMKALMDQASPSREDQLLAQLLDYHRRERRPAWQRFFERHRLRPEDLESDPECLAGLRLIETLDGHRAIYAVAPDREHKVKSGATFKLQDTSSGDKATVTVHDIDLMGGRITLDFPDKEMISSDLTLIPRVEVFFSATLEKGLRQVGEIWLQSSGSMPAVGSILRRDKPRLQKGTIAALLATPGDMTQQAIEVVRQLDRSHLIIQGPPGTGKTTLAAAIIQALLQDGKKVGITSNSHEAINLLLLRTVSLFGKAGSSKRANLQVVKVNRNKEKELIEDNGVVHAKDGKSIKWKSGAQLVGGTAWAFAAESSKGKLDYLFVDEASQVPLANLVAMGLSATNIVLLGDQMQLPNPAQGHHPGDSGLSVLEYLLGDKATVDETEGMFLPTSYRMHPDVCTLVSEMVYEGKLDCDAKTGNQSISKPKSRRPIVDAESGVVFVEVPHAGNSQASKEEVATIKEIVAELKTRQYTDQSGRDRRSLTDADILVVAPYNMQVAQLAQALGNSARVGTVDKFQGQEAPVVIVSMCASDLEEIPRGVEFLLSKNRMNVAISRAQCLAIVVGSPALAESRVASIEGMRLVNLYCRIVANGVGKAKQPKAS
jgi:uncharacterized protein